MPMESHSCPDGVVGVHAAGMNRMWNACSFRKMESMAMPRMTGGRRPERRPSTVPTNPATNCGK